MRFLPVLPNLPAHILGLAASRLATLLAALILLPLPSWALDASKPLSEFMIQTWSVDEGLPHSAIRDIAQTKDGYLWFATHEGVARFDSLNFTVFNEANTPALKGTGVITLLPSKDGGLYIGLRDGGVVRYLDGKFAAVASNPPLPAGRASLLAEDTSGALWCSMGSAGIVRIAGGTAKSFGVADGLPAGIITIVRATADGAVWVGTANGLAVFRGDKFVSKPTRSWLDTAGIADVLLDSNKRLWVATSGEGLAIVEGDSIRRIRRPQGLASESLTRLIEDRNGSIWVGSLEGVQRIERDRPEHIERFTAADGLSNNNIRVILEDSESGVWVGTDQGASRFRESLLLTWGARRGITQEFTRTVLEDRKGRVWTATADGLFMMQDGATRRYGREQGLLTTAVLSLAEDPNGTLWVGTNGGGLHRLVRDRFEQVSAKLALPAVAVRAILPARDGALYVGTATSLLKWSWKQEVPVQRVSTALGQNVEQVTSLHQDARGHVWVGSRSGAGVIDAGAGGPVMKVVEGKSPVLAINGDQKGRVYVSFTTYGLARIEGEGAAGKARFLSRADGVPEQSYFVALDDRRGNLWLCSTRGIVKLPMAQIDERIAGTREKIEPANFTRADGMASTQCNGASQPAGWVMRDGRVLFPTAKGIAVVSPDAKTLAARKAPPVHVRRVSIDGASAAFSMERGVELPSGTHRLEVEYVGLSFSDPEKVRYRYRLEGFDESWVEAQRETKAAFTNITPGEYVFRVRSSREGGEWNDDGMALRVVQKPHFYETGWFRWGGLVVVLLAAFAAYRGRVRQLESQRTLLHVTVQQRTRELELEKQKLESASNEKAKLLVQVADAARAYEKLSKEDALTGLPNRRELDRFLAHEFERAVRNGRPLAVALGDIDFFKKINDMYSHAAGDEVLRSIAQILGADSRNLDMVGRYGGEEFLLVLPDTGRDEAHAICERLRLSVEAFDWQAKGAGPRVTMSFGLAAMDADSSHERLVARADARLYEAKAGGRNRVCG